ncbi:DUF6841 family protein [Nocardia carnea]|uniref:DUF6841 family protein n=1 Tax=Nocardia carnea TaxID=37328 RepID=UPI002454DB4C|nr:nuclear transport factor 2 family protein [Nocardia carnea]
MVENSQVEARGRVEDEVVAAYNAYIDSFNSGDVDACVANFVIPYYDLRTVEGVPTQVLYATEQDARRYFEDALATMRAAGWEGTSSVVNTAITQYGDDMVALTVDFERLTATGEPIDEHRVVYSFIRPAGRWQICGYIAVDADYVK